MLILSPSKEIQLKVIEESDAEVVYTTLKKNKVRLREWLSWIDQVNSLDDFKKIISKIQEQSRNGRSFLFEILYQEKLAGIIDLQYIDYKNKKTSIGYWLAQELEGKGIVTQAIKTLVNFAFTELLLNRVELTIAVDNIKSNKAALNAGFVKEGVLRENEWLYDHFTDQNIYSVLKTEWKK